MKVSNLIDILECLQKQFGDIDIVVMGEGPRSSQVFGPVVSYGHVSPYGYVLPDPIYGTSKDSKITAFLGTLDFSRNMLESATFNRADAWVMSDDDCNHNILDLTTEQDLQDS